MRRILSIQIEKSLSDRAFGRGVLVMPVQRERFHSRGDHDAEGGIGKRAVDEAVRAKVNIHVSVFDQNF